MLPTINSIEEAERFFLRNPSGMCYCVKGDIGRAVDCFSDAEKFYQ